MNRGPGDQLTDLLLWVLGTAAFLAGTLWAAAYAIARLAGAAAPTSDPLTGAWALAHEPDEPSAAWATDVPATGYWAVVTSTLTTLGVLAWLGWRRLPAGPGRR